MSTALLLIDIQNDYFSGGAMELVGMERACANAQKVLHKFRQQQSPIIHIQHLNIMPEAGFFIPDTSGVAIHDSVAPIDNETVITKNYPSSFQETGLYKHMQENGIDSLVVCGAMSHMCIDTTVRTAFALGIPCTLIADACATRDLEFNGNVISAVQVHAAFMAALSFPFATVIDTETWLTQEA
jgi:nicotinamidase-related amidase